MNTDTTRASATAQPLYSEEQVNEALNRAVEDIVEATDAADEGLRDALNLVVNAAMDYLTGSASSLDDVVRHNYDADYATVLTWISGD